MPEAITNHTKQEIGTQLDNFTLPRIGGGPVSLETLLEGKRGAVVVFWSGVCSHCVHYDGYLNGFTRRHPDIALAALASRQGETPAHVRTTMAERKLTFPILHDAGSAVAKAWYTQQTPRAFLLDADRKLLYRGAIDNFKYPEDPDHVPYLDPAIGQFLTGAALTRTETASFGCAIQSVYYILPKAL